MARDRPEFSSERVPAKDKYKDVRLKTETLDTKPDWPARACLWLRLQRISYETRNFFVGLCLLRPSVSSLLKCYDGSLERNVHLSLNMKGHDRSSSMILSQSCSITRHEDAWGERMYSSYSFSTLVLDGGEWLASPRPRFTPEERAPRTTGHSRFDLWRRQEVFSSSLCVQIGSEAHPASCPIGTGGPFPGAKGRPRRDADHSPPPSAEVVDE
jgi:hypothetical protein